MNYILLIFSILVNLIACGIIRSAFCKKDVKNNSDLYLFNTVSSLLSMITLIVIAVCRTGLAIPSMYTIILGLLFGIITALCALLNMKSLEIGPLSYTTVIVSCSMLIPSLSGMILYQEEISLWQYAGAVFMVLSFLCAADKKNDKLGVSVKWFVFCIGTFLFNGGIGVMQKIHQNSAHKDELDAFLIIAFGASAVFSLAMMLYCKTVKKENVTVIGKGKSGKFTIIGIISGVGIALCNIINMYLAGAMDAIIFYPIVNGGCMILTALAGVLMWREKLSRKQWTGVILGLIAVILLCDVL